MSGKIFSGGASIRVCALNPKTIRFGRGEGENCGKQNDGYDANCGKSEI
jgi:hypothetical protein